MRYIHSILFCLFLALQLPASGGVVAYWDFDNGNLNSLVNGTTYNLTQSGAGYTGSTTKLVDPIPNPDPLAGPANGGSITSTGTDGSYLYGANGVNGSRTALQLSPTDSAWTFEGWLNTPSEVAFDPIMNTRNGSAGPGLLFDVRTVALQQVFSLYLQSDNLASVTETAFQNVLAPVATPFHFALTYHQADGGLNGVFELFVNGDSKASHTTTTAFLADVDNIGSTIPLQLLGRIGDTDGSFGGSADEFRISNTALTPDQFLNSVPEPGTALLFLMGGLMALWVRRMRRA